MLYLVANKIGRKTYARILANALHAQPCKEEVRVRDVDETPVIINWGCSSPVIYVNAAANSYTIYNHPHDVSNSVNKLSCLRTLSEGSVPVPEYTSSKDLALEWISDGKKVYCRTLLRASQGRGIVLAETREQLVDAPLYTKRFPTWKEFRVHVVNGEAIRLQQKKRLNSDSLSDRGLEINEMIKNRGNGYIYSSNMSDDLIPGTIPTLTDISIRTLSVLNLDFGAVDLAINRNGRVVVFEVNTAPALIGSTLDAYVDAFNNLRG